METLETEIWLRLIGAVPYAVVVIILFCKWSSMTTNLINSQAATTDRMLDRQIAAQERNSQAMESVAGTLNTLMLLCHVKIKDGESSLGQDEEIGRCDRADGSGG